MKALLLKDYYMLGKSLRFLVLVMALWSLVPVAFLNVFVVVYGSMIPYSAMSYDQQSRWNIFARMLPYRERDIVLSRYVLGWLYTTAAGTIMFALQNILSLFSPLFGCSFRALLAALCVGFFLLDINIPLMLHFGAEKARWAASFITFLTFASVGALSGLINDAKNAAAAVLSLALPGMLVLTIIATAVSIPLSLHIYRKRV